MNLADLIRRLDNLIRPGTVAEVDHVRARCRVRTGGLLTAWLPWFTRRAGTTSEWDPVSVGEQCVVLSPGGDPAVGFVLVGLYCEANPADSADPAVHRTEWANGDFLQHNAETGHTQLICGSLEIQCTGAVSINGSRIDLNG